MKRFYYERDVVEVGFYIIEVEAGYEHGAYFDTVLCIVTDEEDAINLCDKLNQLWENQK